MGYSKKGIFIKPKLSDKEIDTLLKRLGFDNYELKEELRYGSFGYPVSKDVFICEFKNSSFIYFADMFMSMRKQIIIDLEEKISDLLPKHECLSILNVESVNGYLYHYFKDKKTIRLKEGSDWGLDHDIGEELDIEKEYYVKKEKEGDVEYFYTKNYNDPSKLDKWTHDQIGGDVAFKMVELFEGYHFTDKYFYDFKVKRFVIKN